MVVASRTSASFAVLFVATATAIALLQDVPKPMAITIDPVVTGTTTPANPLVAQRPTPMRRAWWRGWA